MKSVFEYPQMFCIIFMKLCIFDYVSLWYFVSFEDSRHVSVFWKHLFVVLSVMPTHGSYLPGLFKKLGRIIFVAAGRAQGLLCMAVGKIQLFGDLKRVFSCTPLGSQVWRTPQRDIFYHLHISFPEKLTKNYGRRWKALDKRNIIHESYF